MKPSSSSSSSKRSRSMAKKQARKVFAPKSLPLKTPKCHTTATATTNHHLFLPPPPPPLTPTDIAEAQRVLGYTFRDPKLLEEALNHPSAASGASYQRLEFVGDAALSLAFTNYHYITNPDVGPGDLSSLRSANVSTEKLARAAVRCGLYRFLRRNAGGLDHMVEDFTRVALKEADGESTGGMSYGGSKKKAPKVLADIVESVAGAVYIDSGLDLEILWQVFRQILMPIVTTETLDEQPVTSLYVHCQKQGMSVRFKRLSKKGKNTVNVFVDGKLVGSGKSEHKQIAKLNAARNAMHNLSSSDEEETSDGTTDEEETDEESSVSPEAEGDGPKTRLYKLCSKRHWKKPEYRIVRKEGPAHKKRFTCAVDVVSSKGKVSTVTGTSKPRVKEAENDAALRMLSRLGN